MKKLLAWIENPATIKHVIAIIVAVNGLIVGLQQAGVLRG